MKSSKIREEGMSATPPHPMKVSTRVRNEAPTVFLLLLLFVLPIRGLASPAPGDDSIRARLKACILSGDITCVVDQYLLLKDIGRVPDWLVAFQNAFAAVNQQAGKCEGVAKTIHQGLTRLGQHPEYLRFTVEGDVKLLGFNELSKGVFVKSHHLSITGKHLAVKLGDKVIDAYTGLAGLPLSEYMARLSTSSTSQILYEVVQTP